MRKKAVLKVWVLFWLFEFACCALECQNGIKETINNKEVCVCSVGLHSGKYCEFNVCREKQDDDEECPCTKAFNKEEDYFYKNRTYYCQEGDTTECNGNGSSINGGCACFPGFDGTECEIFVGCDTTGCKGGSCVPTSNKTNTKTHHTCMCPFGEGVDKWYHCGNGESLSFGPLSGDEIWASSLDRLVYILGFSYVVLYLVLAFVLFQRFYRNFEQKEAVALGLLRFLFVHMSFLFLGSFEFLLAIIVCITVVVDGDVIPSSSLLFFFLVVAVVLPYLFNLFIAISKVRLYREQQRRSRFSLISRWTIALYIMAVLAGGDLFHVTQVFSSYMEVANANTTCRQWMNMFFGGPNTLNIIYNLNGGSKNNNDNNNDNNNKNNSNDNSRQQGNVNLKTLQFSLIVWLFQFLVGSVPLFIVLCIYTFRLFILSPTFLASFCATSITMIVSLVLLVVYIWKPFQQNTSGNDPPLTNPRSYYPINNANQEALLAELSQTNWELSEKNEELQTELNRLRQLQ